MNERDDRDLRQRFQELRREEVSAATPFAAALAAARARRARWPRRLAFSLAAALVAGLAVLVSLTRHHRNAAPIDLATVRWRAPTDFLLDLPGDDLLRTVPELGRMPLAGAAVIHDSHRRSP
jgi:hypothetical protein